MKGGPSAWVGNAGSGKELAVRHLLLCRRGSVLGYSNSFSVGASISAPCLFIPISDAILVKGITISWHPRLESRVALCSSFHNEYTCIEGQMCTVVGALQVFLHLLAIITL